jgi:SAM-dependent methyltransferase
VLRFVLPSFPLLGDVERMDRCYEAELLDSNDVSAEALAKAYGQINRVHRWLGNTSAVLRLLADGPGPLKRVLDIGCGQGALLVEIRRSLGVEVIGFDLRAAPADAPVRIVTGNAVSDPLPEADVAICLVMAHHLTETELADMIGNVGRSCRRFVLLDLVRHPVPLALFRTFVSPLLSRINALDGQTSIRRAYTAKEMRGIVERGLCGSSRPVSRLRHTVSPLWIRQVVDICWEPAG